MRTPKRLPIGMTIRTALGGTAMTIGMAAAMLSLGAQIAMRGLTILRAAEGALGALVVVVALFTAWGLGRGTWKDYKLDLKAKTGAAFAMMATGASWTLLFAGAQLGGRGATAPNMVVAASSTFMLGIMLFTAWNIGRGFWNDDRDDRDGGPWVPAPPSGGESLKPKHDKVPEHATPPRAM